METFRTPDARFAALGDAPEAEYVMWEGLRLAHVDLGPRNAPVALLVHGEPTWSYLYRKMIPGLLNAGYRVVAPDNPGFGRSDKPTEDSWYDLSRHVAALRARIEALDLRQITLFVQDWGGPIGLRQVVEDPERFERLVILNTWLHHEGYAYSDGIRAWRKAALDPDRLGGDMPTGRIVARSLRRPGHDLDAVARAYDAPFEGPASKAGARRFPDCIPLEDPAPGQASLQARDYEALKQMPMPKHVIFGDADEVFPAAQGEAWARVLANATFDTVPGAGHFVQEDAGEEVVEIFLRRRNGAPAA